MSDRNVFSVLGIFDSAESLMRAIPEVKASVTSRLEAYSPFPVHGMEKALGLRKSPITGMVFVMAIIGAFTGLALQLWTSGWDYPQMTAGKPYLSWEAFIPIVFELTVLFAAFTAGLGMLLLLNRLPFFRHPMLSSRSMALVTRDKFALAVEPDGAGLDVDAVSSVLRNAGAGEVEVVEQPAPPSPASPKFLAAVLTGIAVCCATAGCVTYWATKLFPASIPMVHMLDQPRLDPQRANGFFRDGSGMRMPVPGAVVRGSLPYGVKSQEAARDLINPLPRTEMVLKQGHQAYVNYCSVCHGVLGNALLQNGNPILTAAYGAKPANLVSRTVIELADGQIFHVIVAGKNTMPAYAGDLTEEERWAVVHYTRVLQRAMNAKDEDLR